MTTTNTSARKCVHGVPTTKGCQQCHPWYTPEWRAAWAAKRETAAKR